MTNETNRAAPRYEATALGEVLLRLAPSPSERLANARTVDVWLAGAEANVCAALSALGRQTALVTALPDNDLGALALRRLREAGIGTEAIRAAPEGRMGTYYADAAAPPRAVQVIYDRSGSAASQMSADELDLDTLLDTRIVHLSGITPALSDRCGHLVRTVMERARAARVPVSFDVNFRAKLGPASSAMAWIDEHARDVEILSCAHRDAETLFGLRGSPATVAKALWERLQPRFAVVSSGSDGVILFDGNEILEQHAPSVAVVDRPGAGDALAAGVIDGWLDGDLSAGLRTGVVLAALALTQHGDQVVTNRREVEAIAARLDRTADIVR